MEIVRVGNVIIPIDEFRFTFTHSSGPGGQNVNKVATAVQLRFDVAHCPYINEEIRQRLIIIAGKRVNKEGILVIDARRFRTQEANRKDALERFVILLQRSLYKPKLRISTGPTTSSKLKLLQLKAKRAAVKQTRRSIDRQED